MQLSWQVNPNKVSDLLLDKKILMFDLDGTLVLSKSHLQSPMAKILGAILRKKHVAIISGCGYAQMYNQFVVPMINALRAQDSFHLYMSRLHLMPMSGASLYQWDRHESRFAHRYKQTLSLRDKTDILAAFDQAVAELKVKLPLPYGRIEEDRESQVTFSLRGQDAPLEIKKLFDPSGKLRLQLKHKMQQLLPFHEVRVGGTTSLDVTIKGIDKAYGVKTLLSELKMRSKDAAFVGDALFDGGNDASVKKTTVDCIEIASPKDTMDMLTQFTINILSKK